MENEKLKNKVIEKLKEIYDPEIPVNIFDLGLIYDVNIIDSNHVYILMTLTTPSCPSAQTLPVEVENNIKVIEGVKDVTVEVTFDPPYSTDMMSEAAKLELGFL
jgi:FeS assembly SUF system protein